MMTRVFLAMKVAAEVRKSVWVTQGRPRTTLGWAARCESEPWPAAIFSRRMLPRPPGCGSNNQTIAAGESITTKGNHRTIHHRGGASPNLWSDSVPPWSCLAPPSSDSVRIAGSAARLPAAVAANRRGTAAGAASRPRGRRTKNNACRRSSVAPPPSPSLRLPRCWPARRQLRPWRYQLRRPRHPSSLPRAMGSA